MPRSYKYFRVDKELFYKVIGMFIQGREGDDRNIILARILYICDLLKMEVDTKRIISNVKELNGISDESKNKGNNH